MPGAPPQQETDLLNAQGHVLVAGGPGSGKTTLALKKALHRINAGLGRGQAVLFLSFSRAAVARLMEASAGTIPAASREQLVVQTFHSLCWNLLCCHAYLLGAPSRLQILLPHDEKALSSGIDRDDAEWPAWQQERESLFLHEGRIAFDLFAPMTLRLLRQASIIRKLITQHYPLIIVDEAQDTGEDAWQIIQELRNDAQLICLADPEQQIFDHLPGVGPERIAAIRRELAPLEIDLGQQNNRSPGTEIALFGNHLLAAQARGARYDGVSLLRYQPKGDINLAFRKSLAVVYRKVRSRTGTRPDSCAILTPTGRDVAWISAALSNGPKPVAHKVIFDEARALLASRFAAYMLEPKNDQLIDSFVPEALDLLASMEQAAGSKTGRKTADQYRAWALALRQGKPLGKPNVPKALKAVIRSLNAASFTGDPRSDWLRVKASLRDCGNAALASVASHLDYLVAFGRGRFLAANLAGLWAETGNYAGARGAFDTALTQDAILEASQDSSGLHVMTIHRSKGKQFDAVIVLRRGVPAGYKKWRSSFVWRDDQPPYMRSRKILRVAITRARKHVLILEPPFPACPLLRGHAL